MSTTIDNRVVEMQFDNRQFERNVSTSMSTIEKLKQSLNLSGAAKGLESVNAAAKGINLSGLAAATETVGLKFNAMYSIADAALRNITNSAVNAGKRMVSALTVDPIKTGLQEYETQINAIQTIMANTKSKGSTMDDVNKALDELNAYADKTIYNFTEMTRNIGTFTAAGVDLDKSVTSIKGIANLAAISGSTSQQASTAMYQLSQALAAGKVQLMDWNSVVNAGMGGQVFQDALKRTAKNMGTNVDAMIEKYGSFRESLTKGQWLTAEVLTETLTQLSGAYTEADLLNQGYTKKQAAEILELANTAGDAATKVKTFTQLWDTLKESAQSGWTQTWEILIGDFEEAKELFSQVSDRIGAMIGASAQARNDLLESAFGKTNPVAYISELTGMTKESVAELETLGESTGYTSNEFKEMASSIAEGDASMEHAITNMLKFAESGKDVDTYIAELTGLSAEGVVRLKALSKEGKNTAEVFEMMSVDSVESNEMMQNTIDSLLKMSEEMNRMTGRELVIDSIKNSFNALLDIMKPIKEAFREIFPPITADQLYSFLEGIHNLTEKFKVSTELADQLRNIFRGLFSAIDIGVEAVKAIGSGLFSLIGKVSGVTPSILQCADSLGTWIYNLRNTIKETDLFGAVIDRVVGFISRIIEKVKEFGDTAKTAFATPNFEGFLGIFQRIWTVVQTVASKIGEAFGAITVGLADAFGEAGFMDVVNGGLFAGILVGIQRFMGTLTGLFDNAGGFLENAVGILEDVRGCFQAYQEQLKAGSLLKIASAIGILAAAIFVISTIDGDTLASSLGAITVLFGELMGSLAMFSKIGGGMNGVTKAVIMMGGISVSLLILAGALKVVSSIDVDGMTRGLIAIGALMTELGIFLSTVKFDKKMTGTAIGIVILSSSMLILASAVKDFGAMSWEEIGKGLGAIGALLTELALFANLTGNAQHIVSTGVSMVLLGASMKILASAMGDFASMSWEQIGQGLVAMAGSLGILVGAMRLLPNNTMTISVGLIAVGAALKIMASALSDFGGMTWDEIGRGLTVMGGALLELSIALNLMNGTLAGSAALIIAAGAIAILTPALQALGQMTWEEIGKGLLTLAGAFAVIGIAGLLLTPLIPSILALAGAIALVGLAVLGIGAGLTLAGIGITAIATGFTALATAVGAGATAIVAGLTVIIVGVANLIPLVCTKIAEGIVMFAGAIALGIPAICEAIGVVLSALLDLIVTYIPEIVDAGMKLIIGLLEGIAANIGDLIDAGTEVVVNFLNGVADAIPDVIQAAVDLVIDFINALADGIRDNTEKATAAVDNLMSAIGEAIAEWFVEAATMGTDFVLGFVKGIKDAAGDAIEAAKGVVSDALEGAKKLLGINSPSRKFMEVGRYSDEGLAIGLKKYAGKVTTSAKNVGNQAVKALSGTLSSISDAIDNNTAGDLTIRPVLDLSDVESGAKRIGGLLDTSHAVGIMANVGAISSMMSLRGQNGTNDDVVYAINKLANSLGNVGNTTYNVNGVTYDDGSNISDAVRTLVRAAKVERRV